jgi:hypothetical protein
MKYFLAAMAFIILLSAIGCGNSGPMPVSGVVTLDGQPLERGKLDFQPTDNKGPTAAAVIKDGKYDCSVMPGGKTVRITGGKVTGKHQFTPGVAESPMVEDIKPLVPSCYNTESTLTCEIVRGTSSYNFDLKSKK